MRQGQLRKKWHQLPVFGQGQWLIFVAFSKILVSRFPISNLFRQSNRPSFLPFNLIKKRLLTSTRRGSNYVVDEVFKANDRGGAFFFCLIGRYCTQNWLPLIPVTESAARQHCQFLIFLTHGCRNAIKALQIGPWHTNDWMAGSIRWLLWPGLRCNRQGF